MKGVKLSILLYIIGIIFIISIIWQYDIYQGILSVLFGFILITSASILPILINKKSQTEINISEENYIEQIKNSLNLNNNEIEIIKSPIPHYCSIRNITDFCNNTGLSQVLLMSHLDYLKNDESLKKDIGERHYEIIIQRVNDVGIVGDIFLKLKKHVEELNLDELKMEISNIIENYSERYSLSNFLECNTNHLVLDKFLNQLIDEENSSEFVEFFIRNRVGIPHYESNIFAFHMVLHLLKENKVKPNIETDDAKNTRAAVENAVEEEEKEREIETQEEKIAKRVVRVHQKLMSVKFSKAKKP